MAPLPQTFLQFLRGALRRVGVILAWAISAIAATPGLFGKPVPVPFQSEYQADSWGLEEGFPENSCSGIVSAPDGYLWMGTYRGLVRFNGQDFKAWAPAAMPGLRTTGIINMFHDRSGRVWFSTNDGLVRFDGKNWKRCEEADGWRDRTDYARSYADGPGSTVVITRFSGHVMRFDGSRFSELSPPPGAGGTIAGFDRDGTLYAVRAGFAGTLVDGKWKSLSSEEPTIGKRALGAGQTRDGHAVIVCRNEVLRLRGGHVVSRTPLSQEVTTFWQLTEDATGTLWLPSVDSGVYRIRPDGQVKHIQKEDGLPHSGGTRTVFPIEDGSVWVGNGVGGLSRFRPVRFRYLGELEGLGDREVLTVTTLPEGRVLFTPYGAGLRYFDGTTTVRPPELSGDEDVRFRTALRTHDNTVWLGAFSRGLMRLRENQITSEETAVFGRTETVSTLFEDSKGRLWAGGDRHVALRENDQLREIKMEAAENNLRPTIFAERQDGTMLLARQHQIFTFADSTVNPHPLVQLPVACRISTLLVDARGRIWIGTAGHGLAVHHEGRVHWIDRERGLPGHSIAALVPDQLGNLWFGSGRNVVRADPEHLWALARDHTTEPKLHVFDRNDGMRDLDFPFGTQPTVARADNGHLWFALIRGAATVDPAALHLNAAPPRIVGESISYVPRESTRPVEQALPATETPLLPAGSRLIRINFAALDFTAPRKQRFHIRLDHGGEWQDLQNESTISFLELPPGDHSLRIRASSSDGVWSQTDTNVAFKIAPFYWQTHWFQALAACGALGLAFSAAWFTANRQTRAAREALDRERRLAEALARLALVLENTSDFVAYYDTQDQLVYINAAGRAMVGIAPAEDIRKLSARSLLPEWARSQFSEQALPAALRDGTWSGESALRHVTGREIPVSQMLFPRRSPDGTLEFTAMIARDISVAKRNSQVQEALRGLAKSLTAPLEISALGREVGRAARTLFHYDAFFLALVEENGAVGYHAYFEDTPEGEDAPRPVDTTIRTLSPQVRPVLRGESLLINRDTNSPFDSQHPLRPLGVTSRRSLSIMYAPVKWEQRVVGILSLQSYTLNRFTDSDVRLLETLADHCGAAIARMETEAALRKNEERLRLAMQAARMGSWEIDPVNDRLSASLDAEAIYGVRPGTLSGPVDNLVRDVPAVEAEPLRRALHELVEGLMSEFRYMHRITPPGGTERWIEIRCRPQELADLSGRIRIIGVVTDVTSRQLAEIERLRLEEQLRQSQKLEAVGTLAGGIAHDFNNILGAILGNVELAALEAFQAGKPSGYLEKIKQSGMRARELVRRILTFSRPESSKPQATELVPVVDEVIDMLQATVPTNLEIVKISPSPVPPARIDSTKLNQVLLNLGTNACHALEHRPGRIEYVLGEFHLEAGGPPPHPDLAPGHYARVDVRDNGIGIAPEIRSRIFDPFFTTRSPGEGSGLGLSVVHGIMRACGGAVAVKSSAGAGSTFSLFFPVASETLTGPSHTTTVPGAAANATRVAGRILFVDDEEPLVLFSKTFFQQRGLAVEGHLQPTEALLAFRQRPHDFDLVITDLSMPTMSGIELAREVRQTRPDIPIVLISGNVRSSDAAAARQAGVNEIVEKPFTLSEFLPVVVRLLGARKSPAPPAPPP